MPGREDLAHLSQLAGIAGREHQAFRKSAAAGTQDRIPRRLQRGELHGEQALAGTGGQVEQRVELVAAERMSLGRALHLDEAAAIVHDDVHVGLGPGVLGVIEIDHRRAAHDADRNRGDLAVQRIRGERAPLPQCADGIASATYAPVIEAVRVPPSACSTSQSSVTVRSPSARMSTTARNERPIRRWISSVRPLCLPRAASRALANVSRAAACRIRR